MQGEGNGESNAPPGTIFKTTDLVSLTAPNEEAKIFTLFDSTLHFLLGHH